MTNNFSKFALANFCKARKLFAIAAMAGLLTALSFHSVTASGLWPVSRLSLVSMNGKTRSGADAPSAMPAVSADGRYVAFQSRATDLVAHAGGAFLQVFVRNVATGTFAVASAGRTGIQGNAASSFAAISDTGRYVAFESAATNLVPGHHVRQQYVFIKDMTTGRILEASVRGVQDANAASTAPAISGNGSYVAFESAASNLDGACAAHRSAIFVKARGRKAPACASVTQGGVAANSDSHAPSLSESGQYVAFESAATNLDAACNDGLLHVFVKDLAAGNVVCVSTTGAGAAANAASRHAAISASGRYVAFESAATNLDAACTNGRIQVFVKDVTSNHVVCGSAFHGAAANQNVSGGKVSSDGTRLVFQSNATNLVAHDASARTKVFVKDLVTGAVSIVSGPRPAIVANADAADADMTPDAHFVVFDSIASNLVAGDANKKQDVFITRNPLAQGAIRTIALVSNTTAVQGIHSLLARPASQANGYSGIGVITMSDDNQSVVFDTIATNLVSSCVDPDSNETYVRKELATGDLSCVQPNPGTGGFLANRKSADGRYQIFQSASSTLDPKCFRTMNVFVQDNVTGKVGCISVNTLGAHGNENSTVVAISPDGTKALFASPSTNFIDLPASGNFLYLKDLVSGALRIASVDEKGQPFWPIYDTAYSVEPKFSSDGGSFFYSDGDNIYIQDVTTGSLRAVPLYDGTGEGSFYFSSDWRYIVAPGCPNSDRSIDKNNVSITDTTTGSAKCVSTNAKGERGNKPAKIVGSSGVTPWVNPVVSDDGRYVVFASLATNLVPNDTNLVQDVFVKDTITGAIARVSVSSSGKQGLDDSYNASISRDGRYVLFGSYSANLVSGDTNTFPDVFVTPNPLFQ